MLLFLLIGQRIFNMADFLNIQVTISQVPNQLTSIQKEANEVFDKLVQYVQRSYDAIWNNPDPTCTAEEMWKAIGTAGISALQSHAAAVTFIETIRPGTLNQRFMSAPKPYTINQDGSITINT